MDDAQQKQLYELDDFVNHCHLWAVITGGSGFLGVCVAKELIERNSCEKIVLTDIIQSRRLEAVKDKAVFVKADLTLAQACCELVTEEVGMIYHFASLVSGGAERDDQRH